ncbi:MAG: Asp-tRNA(Asn)/Glu-tRNA(Gln) amidotransferase GatCAB subunit A [Rhodobacteraceae bacterium]|nr:Asp-tRNA(Asn)/Glu-tRNA(Gln) amidotransferase GatCAB subunit A [Paracoccaceae bacterium]
MNIAATQVSTLCDLTLTEAAEAVAKGEVTSVELTEAALAAFDLRDGQINSVIWMDRDAALATAAALDARQKAGAPLGPLHGVPLAHKDMYYQAGKLSTCGSKIRADFRPDYTATVIDRLHAAGTLTLGGLNMAEFAQNPTGHNVHYGDCHNPWGLDYCTGGSSSGSGAAVAGHCVTAALGSDTGGSIRLPAAICGVTGLKPTQTRVSRHGVMPLSFSCDNVGPLARTARDCAAILSVIAGHDPMDPTSAAEPVPDYAAMLTGDIRGLKVGVPETYFLDDASPEIGDAFATALDVLKARGAKIVSVTLPEMEAVSTYGGIVSRCEGATIHAQWMRERPEDYATHLSGRMYAGFAIPAVQYIEALARRGAILRAFAAQVFGTCDVLATPTLRWRTPTLAASSMETGGDDAIDTFMNVSINTRPLNYLGLPAVSVPCGFDENAMPIGLQIAGRPFAEGKVLKVADAFQADTDWHALKSPVARMI